MENCVFLLAAPDIQHPARPCATPAAFPFPLLFLRRRRCKAKRDGGKREKEEGRGKEKVEKRAESGVIIKRRAKMHEAERRPHWRGQKSLVSLVSSTRLKGQMESQWGSLSGSHYWNRKFFFLFTYTQSQSWKQLALRDSSVFLPNEWNKSVCLHSRSYTFQCSGDKRETLYFTVNAVCIHSHLDKLLFWHTVLHVAPLKLTGFTAWRRGLLNNMFCFQHKMIFHLAYVEITK